MLTGPDVSHWQQVIDWRSVARHGHAFAICKATEDVGTVDGFFARNYAGIRAGGMLRGSYHFLRREWGAADQARHYVAIVRSHGGFGGALAAVDVETRRFTAPPGRPAPSPTNPTPAQVRDFVRELRRLVPGQTLLVYTGHGWWTSYGGNAHGADLGPLWHARHGVSEGQMYGGWPAPTIWQHTDAGSCPGVAGACDMNRFFGDRAALARLAGEEDDMTPEQVEMLRDADARSAEILRLLRDDGDIGRRLKETTLLARAIADIDPSNDVAANVGTPHSRLRSALRRLVRMGADDAAAGREDAPQGSLAERLAAIEADIAELKARL